MATTNLTNLKANALTNVVSTILSTTNIISSAVPKISSITYPGDDTAASTAGGQTITLTGTGFNSGASVLINGTFASVVTVVSSTSITFTSPAISAGTYALYVINTDGGTAISVPGISYSGVPSWSTTAGSLATLYETAAISNTLSATGDATVTYSLYSGTLPPGSSLNTSTGLISGTSQGVTNSTTYNFVIRATDGQNQDTDRSFSITINPDVVTWSSPTDNSTVTAYEYGTITPITLAATSAAGKSITYTANTLPTGVTLSGTTISGTPTVIANTNTLLTANAASTYKTATRNLNFVVNQDVVTWSSPADGTTTSIYANVPMANVTLSATSAAGQSISYAANALPTGVTISGSTVTGTPTTVGNTTSVITATAATTNRTATRTFYWTVSVGFDSYFKNVATSINGDTAVTPFINDASSNNVSLTVVGSPVPVPFSPYQEGYYSNFFDGTGDYITAAANTAFVLGTGDFTVEGWVYPNSLASDFFIISSSGTGGFFIGFSSSGTIGFGWGRTGTAWDYRVAGNATVNTWQHVAVTRSGTSMRLFVNGVQSGTTQTISTAYDLSTTSTTIGSQGAAFYLNGYLSNVRVVKGTAVYTTNFTPSTSPLTTTSQGATASQVSLLTCQSNRLIDNSPNLFALTKVGDTTVSAVNPYGTSNNYGSVYFPSASDYTTFTGSTAQVLGTGDFTVECWLYATNSGSTTGHNISRPGTLTNTWTLQTYNNAVNWLFGSSTIGSSSTGSVPIYAWTHIVVSRVSGVNKGFINGVQVWSVADTNNYSATPTRPIGPGAGGSAVFYLSDFRVTVGTGTTSPSVPTSPVSALTNTQLLTYQYKGSATNNTFVDNSQFNNIVTRNGNSSLSSFSPYSPISWSTYFNGSTDWMSSSGGTGIGGTSFGYGTGDFTWEMWIFPVASNWASGNFYFMDHGSNGGVMQYNAGVFRYYSNAAVAYDAPAGMIPANQWSHIAVSRVSGMTTTYVNGAVAKAATADTANYSTSQQLWIGRYGAGGNYFSGYMSNVRIVKGVGVYTGVFTPPTAPLTPVQSAGTNIAAITNQTVLLINQSNRFINNSGTAVQFDGGTTFSTSGTPLVSAFGPFGSITESVPTSYSNYFGGSGDYLSTPANAAFALDADYTIEAWVYRTDSGTQRAIVDLRGGSNLNILFYMTTANKLVAFNSTSTWITSSGTIPLGTWTHVAITRSGSSVKLFINGTVDGTATNSELNVSSGPVYIGRQNGSTTSDWMGNISNVRIVKGQALYTGNFTPATSPLTKSTVGTSGVNVASSITGTVSLLSCQSTTMIDNSVNIFTLTQNGAPKVYNFNPFGYTAQTNASYNPSIHSGSVFFDGTGDYITTPTSPVHATLGTSDFGVEGWFYYNNVSNTQLVFSHRNATTGAGGYVPFLLWVATGTLAVYSSSTNSTWDVANGNTAGTITPGQWTHIAFTRTGTTFRVFVNGIQTLTYTSSASFTCTQPFQVGMSGPTETNTPMNGYVTDVRMVKGVSPYTSNFIPPTRTLTDYSATYPSSLLYNFNNGAIIDQHSTIPYETGGNTQLSTAVKKNGSASIYLDGSGDYLSTTHPILNLSVGDFTVEGWANTSSATQQTIFNINDTASLGYGAVRVQVLANQTVQFLIGPGGSWGVNITGGTITLGQWFHFSVNRSANNVYCFINGNQVGATTTYSTALVATGTTYIGTNSGTAYQFNGYLDEFRVTKGYARYTANNTPSASFVNR